MLSIIVAKAANNVIGKDNKLIWNIPDDLKRFKKITTGHTIIMGRKTFESLGRILPNRKHVILCNDMEMNIEDERVEILEDISLLDKYINSEEENFVIGGATIYKLLMPYVDKMYITEIEKEFEGDAVFPNIDEKEWSIENIELPDKTNQQPFEYKYITYIRKK